MIEAKGLTRVYPGVIAVNNVSFKIEKGEIVGFLGPNGAGKTTTMRILTTFLPATSGTATVAGFDVHKQALKVKHLTGYLPENNPLYNEMRIIEYLNYRARIKHLAAKEHKSRVEESLERCGLSDIKYRVIGQLSKGLKQRVGLADAIVHNPQVLILDEPTIGLDPNQIREVRNLIRELGQDKTVILSTHILSEVEIMCRRVLIIHQGKIVADGETHQIARDLQVTGRIRVEVIGDGKLVKEQIETLPKVLRVFWNKKADTNTYIIETGDQTDIRDDIFQLAIRNNWRLRELATERLSLEEAFSRLTEIK